MIAYLCRKCAVLIRYFYSRCAHFLVISHSRKASCHLTDRIGIGSCTFICDRIKAHASVCRIRLRLQCFSVCILQFKAKFACYQGTACQLFPYCQRCTCASRLVAVCKLCASCVAHFRSEFACLGVVCHGHCNIHTMVIICDPCLISFCLTDRVSIGSCLGILDRIKGYLSVCRILLRLQHCSVCILQFEAELVCRQGFSCQTLAHFKGCTRLLCLIAVPEDCFPCSSFLIAYLCCQCAVFIRYFYSRCAHLFVISHSRKASCHLTDRIGIGSCTFICDRIKAHASVCRIRLRLQYLSVCILQFKAEFACYQGTACQLFPCCQRCPCASRLVAVLELCASCITHFCNKLACLGVVCHSHCHVYTVIVVCNTCLGSFYFTDRVNIGSCLGIFDRIKCYLSVCRILLRLQYFSVLILQFEAELVCFQILSCQALAHFKDCTCLLCLIAVPEDCFLCSSFLIAYLCRKCAVLIRYFYSRCAHFLVISHSRKASCHLTDRIGIGSCTFICDRIKAHASVCRIRLRLQYLSVCILQFKAELACFQGPACQFFPGCQGCTYAFLLLIS